MELKSTTKLSWTTRHHNVVPLGLADAVGLRITRPKMEPRPAAYALKVAAMAVLVSLPTGKPISIVGTRELW